MYAIHLGGELGSLLSLPLLEHGAQARARRTVVLTFRISIRKTESVIRKAKKGVVQRQPVASVPPKLGRRAQLVRADIVGSAAKSFATKGFAGTTMDDVAKQAGYAASSLYGYFSGKEELFVATIEAIATQVLEVFDDPLRTQLPFVERIAWILRRVCQLVEPNRELFVLLFGHAPFLDWNANASPDAATVGKRTYRKVIQRLADEIAADRSQRLSKREALDLAYVVAGAFQSWVFRWIHGDLPEGLQRSLDRFFELLRPLLSGPVR